MPRLKARLQDWLPADGVEDGEDDPALATGEGEAEDDGAYTEDVVLGTAEGVDGPVAAGIDAVPETEPELGLEPEPEVEPEPEPAVEPEPEPEVEPEPEPEVDPEPEPEVELEPEPELELPFTKPATGGPGKV